LKRVERNWQYLSPEGDLNVFLDPDGRIERGQIIRLLGAFLELIRHDNRYVVTQWDVESGEIQRCVFASECATDAPALVAVENVSGDGVEVAWEASGRLRTLRQRIENRTVLVNYSPAGRISSLALVTDGGARTELVRYEYDAVGRLTAAFDRRGLANRYEYDADSRVTREILRDGAVYSYRYDDRGRCIHFSGLDRYNEKHLRFMDAARTTIVTNSYGRNTIYEYLPSGQIAGEVDPSGNQRRTVFDEHNRIVAKVEPTGATTRYTYDEHGNRDCTSDPLGNTHRFVFNAHHQPVSLTDPLGKRWLLEYDAKQRVIASQNPLGARWKIDYDESGNPAVITDPLSSSRSQRFANGLLQEMTDWMGQVTRFSWDHYGRLVERVGPVGDCTAFRYDPSGNLIEVNLPDGGRLRATYDGGDNLSSFTDAKGYTTRFRYGPCHRLLERVDAIGRVVRYRWGSEPERLDAFINEKGETFSHIRDDQGRIVCERSFGGREELYDYDAAGRCVAFTNGNGERIHLNRDAAGRLTEQILPDGTATRFEFDSRGGMVTAASPDIRVSFEYDAAGRLICEMQGEHWVRTYYNAADEVIGTKTSLGHEVHYELDPNGRVRKLSTGNNHTLAFVRDARGLETMRQMPGGLRLEQDFDVMGRLLQQRVGRASTRPGSSLPSPTAARIPPGHEVITRGYGYDAMGLLLTIRDGRWGATDFTYDPAERLLSALRNWGLNERFEYDAADNLTRTQQQGHDSNDQSSTYGPGNLLMQRGDTRYEYDRDGRLVRKTEFASTANPHVWEYIWDAEGRLRRLRRPDGEVWEYKYDAFSRRIAKIGPNNVLRFLWDGDVVIHELRKDAPAVTWVMQRYTFAPVAKIQEKSIFAIINDYFGTPREMFDSSGKLVWAASISAWGQIERKDNSNAVHDCPIRFQGQWFDEESGLHYNRYRYYDSTDARFISSDPTGLEGGKNLYQYAINPIIWLDPLGLAGKGCGDTVSEDKGAKIVQHPSKRAARRAAEREAGMGKHGGREVLPQQELHPGSQAPQGPRGTRTEVRSTDTGNVVHHDPYGHKDGNIPPHYGVDHADGSPTTHHTYPTTHDPETNR